LLPAFLAMVAAISAQPPLLPLKDLKPGMHGIGKTVFSGDRIDDFQVEILGVLENIGPRQSLILGRLSGGPLEKTGVLQGMSGSPVYVDGKLIGAVAMAFPFAKEPIAGIRPIEEMLRVGSAPAERVSRAGVSLADKDLTRRLPRRQEALAGDARMVDIATPVSFSGFTRATLEHFGPKLRSLGLEPTQGISSSGRLNERLGNPASLKPGSMISVQLMTGDLSVGADGTVTYIDGNRIYGFGHRFLSVGSTALPFARSEVLAVLPVVSTSFKISTPKELLGTIFEDRNTAVAGELGRSTGLAPLSITVARAGRKPDSYQMQMVGDRFLAPLLVQMAVFSAIDATERTTGASSLRITGEIEFQGSAVPVKLNNMYAADAGSAMMASLSTAIPLAYILQSGFESLQVRKVAISVDAFDEKKQLQIDGVSVARREVRPGEQVELTTVLVGENGAEVSRKITYPVPPGAPPGTLYFTVADGNTTNFAELRQIIANPPKSVSQLISNVNSLRANTKAYVRVWRADPAFQLEGADLPDPPPSVALILAGSQTASGGITQSRNSKLAELEISAGDTVVTGSKTIQVEVKE
jgi:hypothetical protein